MNTVIILIVSLIAGAIIGYLVPKKAADARVFESEIENLKQRNLDLIHLMDSEKALKMQALSDLTRSKEEFISKNVQFESLNTQFNNLVTEMKLLEQANEHLASEKEEINRTLSTITAQHQQVIEGKNLLLAEKDVLNTKIQFLEDEKSRLNNMIAQFNAAEENRLNQYEANMSSLNSIKEQITKDREKEVEEKHQAELVRRDKLKETWALHESNVKSNIQSISKKHTIDYVTDFPHKGIPDNCLKICDEYVVFDAKSPANTDNMNNFPSYIKTQAESAKKYAKLEDVKKDIFFVVPTNTLEILNQFVYNMADYTVYVISLDSVEQIILGLKKIEEYEFAKELSPEDRDHICRIIGKFAHLTKRRIQIDTFFAKQFIELAYKAESDLPQEIMEKVKEYDKSEKLNPPIEKRVKAIVTKELDNEINKIESESAAKGIVIDGGKMSDGINDLPLYTDDLN
jgi:hypothetical protein